MKKGTKRKTKHNDAESKPESEPNKKQPTKATTSRATKPNPSKPHSEPQFFEDKRNLVIFHMFLFSFEFVIREYLQSEQRSYY
ncbi:hypothetical protein Lalb_Chr11g0068031 [Lupinus albus]|uniref:Uncharacterized protein n=1 Tax=Lupinus albus TaxID=3870 RepID=A0A6A4PR88_LUPAL|nr:hypothetical protein Lalb_Chr11g0068031 [Lupinus albus]